MPKFEIIMKSPKVSPCLFLHRHISSPKLESDVCQIVVIASSLVVLRFLKGIQLVAHVS
jgi:hypothetical protein